jgi:hypothetical protein
MSGYRLVKNCIHFYLQCPGSFRIDCVDDPAIVQCKCNGELWMKKGCEEAFYCHAAFDGISNQGQLMQCPPGQIVEVTDFSNPTNNWKCSTDLRKCPDRPDLGGFHIGGCIPEKTSAGNELKSQLALIFAIFILFAN